MIGVTMMRQNEVFPYYRKTCAICERLYEEMKSKFETDYVHDLAQLRGYPNGTQVDMIRDLQLGCCDISDTELDDDYKEVGLVTKSGNFLLGGRYIIPVRDYVNNLVSFIGYYPDNRKYITAPSPFFSKATILFNFYDAYERSFKNYNGVVFLVEGIFDCLSLRSIGLPVVATMGSSVGSIKKDLLTVFNKVIAIPDGDAVGRRALNRYDKKYGWQVPFNTTFIRFQGGTLNGYKVKDMDDFVKLYEPEDICEILLSYADSKEEIEDLIL